MIILYLIQAALPINDLSSIVREGGVSMLDICLYCRLFSNLVVVIYKE